MKSIYEKQRIIQNTFSRKMNKPSPVSFDGNHSKKTVIDFILEHSYFMSQEVDEILAEVAGTRNRVKPWNKDHESLKNELFMSTDRVKEEAMDMLAFAMNILMACGITPEDIEDEYDKVYDKVTDRQLEMK